MPLFDGEKRGLCETGVMAAIAAWLVVSYPTEWVASARFSLWMVLLDWTVASAALLLVYLTVSLLEDFAPILRAAVLSAVPAIWFVPALALVRMRDWLWIGLGLVLMANSFRLLLSRGFARRDAPAPRRRGKRSRRRQTDNPFIFIFGAVLFQAGITWTWAYGGIEAAIVASGGVAIWIVAAILRGVYRPGKQTDSPVRAICSVIIAIALCGLYEANSRAHPTSAKSESPKRIVTRLFARAQERYVSGLDGVILRPAAVRPMALGAGLPGLHWTAASRAPFEFSGEYRLYPASTRDVEKRWNVDQGTPVDAVFETTAGGALETEADQALSRPIDFRCCHRVRVTLVSHERSPAAVTLELIGDLEVAELGPEVFGLGSEAEEGIEFAVPESSRDLRVTALRLRFRCIERDCARSLRVAVVRFRLD